MKRFFIFIIMLAAICIKVRANSISEDKFVNSLKNCNASYSESGTTNINGVEVQSQKRILGWHDGRCKYTESLNYGGTNFKLVCGFTKLQIDEIVSVADAYYLTLKYSNEQPDLSSTEAIQNNPVARVLSKYLQDDSVCSFEGLQ